MLAFLPAHPSYLNRGCSIEMNYFDQNLEIDDKKNPKTQQDIGCIYLNKFKVTYENNYWNEQDSKKRKTDKPKETPFVKTETDIETKYYDFIKNSDCSYVLMLYACAFQNVKIINTLCEAYPEKIDFYQHQFKHHLQNEKDKNGFKEFAKSLLLDYKFGFNYSIIFHLAVQPKLFEILKFFVEQTEENESFVKFDFKATDAFLNPPLFWSLFTKNDKATKLLEKLDKNWKSHRNSSNQNYIEFIQSRVGEVEDKNAICDEQSENSQNMTHMISTSSQSQIKQTLFVVWVDDKIHKLNLQSSKDYSEMDEDTTRKIYLIDQAKQKNGILLQTAPTTKNALKRLLNAIKKHGKESTFSFRVITSRQRVEDDKLNINAGDELKKALMEKKFPEYLIIFDDDPKLEEFLLYCPEYLHMKSMTTIGISFRKTDGFTKVFLEQFCLTFERKLKKNTNY